MADTQSERPVAPPPSDKAQPRKVRWALALEYAGNAYCGWQRQAGQPSVQAELERALSQVAAEPVSVIAAGRTDTGVHASLQVVHFDVHSVVRTANAWVRGTTRFLPPDIAVRWAQPVPEHFHARFAARSRRYVYWLVSQPARPGLLHGRVGWTHWPLQLAPMQAALRTILGQHDFSAFRAAECQAKSPVKTLYAASVVQPAPHCFRFDFHADAFLHHMIRNLIGALVYIGNQRQPADWLQQLLQQRDRRLAAPTFAPDGLYLAGVTYDPAFALPETFVEPWCCP